MADAPTRGEIEEMIGRLTANYWKKGVALEAADLLRRLLPAKEEDRAGARGRSAADDPFAARPDDCRE